MRGRIKSGREETKTTTTKTDIAVLVVAAAVVLGLLLLLPTVEGGSLVRNPPDYLMRLYRSTTDERGRLLAPQPYYADSVLAFLEDAGKIDSTSKKKFFFNITPLPTRIVPIQAELHLYRTAAVSAAAAAAASAKYPQAHQSPSRKSQSHRTFIFLKLSYLKTDPNGSQIIQVLEVKRIFRHYYGWIIFNVNEAFTHWIQSNHSSTEKELIVEEFYSDGTPIEDGSDFTIIQRGFRNAHRLQPCLIVYCRDRSVSRNSLQYENDDMAQDFLRNDPWRYHRVYMQEYSQSKPPSSHPSSISKTRTKRNIIKFTKPQVPKVETKTQPPGSRNYCRRRKMVVNFAKLNMTDWILAPLTFDAGVCSGHCVFPLGHDTHPTNHAVLQSVWARHLASEMGATHQRHALPPPPCCVPHELEALPMLYFELQDRVVLNHRPDMVVRSCGCK